MARTVKTARQIAASRKNIKKAQAASARKRKGTGKNSRTKRARAHFKKHQNKYAAGATLAVAVATSKSSMAYGRGFKQGYQSSQMKRKRANWNAMQYSSGTTVTRDYSPRVQAALPRGKGSVYNSRGRRRTRGY